MKFLRRNSPRHVKLGKKRKKKQVWRRPTGRHNKMREKIKGYPVVVSKGYRSNKLIRGKILDKKPVIVHNLSDLEKLDKNKIIIIGKVGKKKKIEIIKKIKSINLPVYGLNPDKFLKKFGEKVK